MTRKYKREPIRRFKKFTLDVVKSKRQVDPNEPKIWVESTDGDVSEILEYIR
jgi:hypothetical protein